MGAMIIIAAVLVLIVSVVTSYQIIVKKTQDQKEILSVSSSSTESPSPSPTSPTPTPSATPSPSSNNSQVTIKQAVKDNSSTSQTFNLSDFKYPNSSQVGSVANGIKLESSDDPKIVTDWYEEKIKSLGFKSKSFVKTNTNGQILNKLVAASVDKEVRVEIEKSAGSSKVIITVTAT